jgi:hypothetical protein
VKTDVEVEVRNVTYYAYRRQPSFDWLKNYEYPNIITGTNMVCYKHSRNITIFIENTSTK